MRLYTGEEIVKLTDNLLSEKHQVKPNSLQLTVRKVFAVTVGGDIDFGGSEEKAVEVSLVDPVKRTSEDKYGWWSLKEGHYFVEFNEKVKVPSGCRAVVMPLSRTLAAGAFHVSVRFSEGEVVDKVLVIVSEAGFNIKENARISDCIMREL